MYTNALKMKKIEALCRELNIHEMKHSEEYYYTIRNMDKKYDTRENIKKILKY